MLKEEIVKIAKECGFDVVGDLDPQTLTPMDMVYDACKENKCGKFGTNWGCSPHDGKEADTKLLRSYSNGLILQCIGRSEKRIDRKMYQETGERLSDAMRKLTDIMRKEYPECMALGAGGCRVCEECARPEPCRFPQKRIVALEGYGIFVTQLCRDNGVEYNYGPGTISYNAAILW